MNNKCLSPLLSYVPERAITPFGINLRKFLYPIFRAVIPLTVQRKIVIIHRGNIPKDKPVIFVSTHEFREDAEAAYIAAGKSAYILNGSVSIIMNTFNGITNWAVGMIVVDRADKESRRASKEKMVYAIKHGASIIIYPEGTWNKSPNQVISGLFSGVYDVAKATKADVVAIASIRTDDTVYAKTGNSFNISDMERSDAIELVKEQMGTLKWDLMDQYSQGTRSELPYGKAADFYWQSYIDALMGEVPFYDYELEKHTKYIEKDVCLPVDAFSDFIHKYHCLKRDESVWTWKKKLLLADLIRDMKDASYPLVIHEELEKEYELLFSKEVAMHSGDGD